MKVIAIKKGYFGKLREPGDVFDVPDKSKASWFEPANGKKGKPEADKEPGKEPETLAELSAFEHGTDTLV